MSGPMTRDQWPAYVREFHDKLDAFNLAVGEWLALDPAQVFNFNLTEGKEPEFDPKALHGITGGEYTRVTWESTEKQTPAYGHVTHGARSDEGLEIVFTAELVIDWMDDRERIAVAGTKPQVMSDQDEARLRGMFGAR